jgi:hypothetical protein
MLCIRQLKNFFSSVLNFVSLSPSVPAKVPGTILYFVVLFNLKSEIKMSCSSHIGGWHLSHGVTALFLGLEPARVGCVAVGFEL